MKNQNQANQPTSKSICQGKKLLVGISQKQQANKHHNQAKEQTQKTSMINKNKKIIPLANSFKLTNAYNFILFLL